MLAVEQNDAISSSRQGTIISYNFDFIINAGQGGEGRRAWRWKCCGWRRLQDNNILFLATNLCIYFK
jgi:hypothetical protein